MCLVVGYFNPYPTVWGDFVRRVLLDGNSMRLPYALHYTVHSRDGLRRRAPDPIRRFRYLVDPASGDMLR